MRAFCLEPRTFKLYDELTKGEQGIGDQSISYGLDDPDDNTFTNWNGTIVGPPNTNFDNRIYFLSINCGPQYPEAPPTVKFNSKINIPCVNQANGTVNFARNNQLASWNPSMSIETVLVALKQEMVANKRLQQPADGECY